MNDIVVGADLYNFTTTGQVAKTLNCAATDADHISCVVVKAGAKKPGRKPESCIVYRKQKLRHGHCGWIS